MKDFEAKIRQTYLSDEDGNTKVCIHDVDDVQIAEAWESISVDRNGKTNCEVRRMTLTTAEGPVYIVLFRSP